MLNPEKLVENPCTVLAIGPWDRGEFAVVMSQIAEAKAWSVAENCATAGELLTSSGLSAEIIILAEPLPATYDQRQIEKLRQLAPIAQLVVVAGSWCEGELRTGTPQQGVLRLYWHEAVHWWNTRTEQVLSWPHLDGPRAPRGWSAKASPLRASLAISTPTLEAYQAISVAIGKYGASCRWVREHQNFETADIGIWDGGQLEPWEWRNLQRFATKLLEGGGKLVVMLDFPRKEHVERLRTLGCETVFGKPLVLAELVNALARLEASD